MPHRRIRPLAVFALLTALALQGCAAGQHSLADVPATEPLKIAGALGVVELAPVHLAVAKDYPAGSKIANGGVPALIADDPVDVATNAETQLLRQSVKRPDLRAIMTIVEGNYRIVARKSAGISNLADLKGKRVATLNATSAEYFLYRMLRTAGLSQADIQQQSVMPLANMVAGLKDGSIDAVAIWEPFSENAARAIGDDAIEFSGKGIYRELFNLNTRADVLADPAKRASVVALLRSIIKANQAMNSNPAEAQALVSKAAGYPVADLVPAWKHHTWLAGFAPDMLDVLVAEEAWLAGIEKRTPRSRAELATLIDRSVYEEAVKGL